MKYKFLTLSLLLAGVCATTIKAQETNYYTPKWSDNIFISVGGGIHSVANDGFNRISPNFSISLGKYITPTWGIRGQVNGIWQSLCLQEIGYHEHNKNYVGANIDAMVNLSSLFAGANPNRFFEVYGFVGPQLSVAKSANVVYTYDGNTGERTGVSTSGEAKAKARIGASAGLGLKFNLNNKWAIDVEARGAIAPSIFGNISDHRKAEGTGMITAGVSYTFGGKKFAKVEDRVVEKEVIKEVVREVPKEVVKEVIKEVPSAAEVAIFFKIGKAKISSEGMVNVQLMAKAIKANPNAKYKIAGFADKATGSASFNQTLSEKRAQAVYDALVAEGVKESQLEKVAMGGTDNMFGKNYLNRVVILEVKYSLLTDKTLINKKMGYRNKRCYLFFSSAEV